jgi:ParB-like chromosome segregation protein Spo0J
MADLLTAYKDPEKHAREIEVSRIVADEKVHEEGVGRYAESIRDGRGVKPIIVIKHPKKDEYAVLDGHHRFWALKESGAKTVRCAVVEDYIGLGFHLTKNGVFQPSAEFTKYVRAPAKQLQDYLTRFLKDPDDMLREQLKLK